MTRPRKELVLRKNEKCAATDTRASLIRAHRRSERASLPSLRPFSPYILYTNVPVYRFSIFLRVTKSCIPWLRLQHELSRARAGKRRKKAGHILHSRALSDEFKSVSTRKKKKLQEFIPKAA